MSLPCVSSVGLHMCARGSANACNGGWMRIDAHVRVALLKRARAPPPKRARQEEGRQNQELSYFKLFLLSDRLASQLSVRLSSVFPLLSPASFPCLNGWWPAVVRADVRAPLWPWPDRGLLVQHIWESGSGGCKVRAGAGFKKEGDKNFFLACYRWVTECALASQVASHHFIKMQRCFFSAAFL